MRFVGVLFSCLWVAGCGIGHNGSDDPDQPGAGAGRRVELGSPQSGEATFYDATGAGNCSFPATPEDLMVAALNAEQYGKSGWCGACAEVKGGRGSVVVRIVDQCPECANGDLDLSREAFAAIDSPEKGRVPIEWKFVSCPVNGALRFHYKEGSNAWWTAIQVRNHRLPLEALYVEKEGKWVAAERQSYNYFVVPDGGGTHALRVKVVGFGGLERVETLPAPVSDRVVEGSSQF